MFKIKKSPPQGLRKDGPYSPEFRDFVKQCLLLEPSLRPTAHDLLSHPFMKVAQGKSLLSQLVAEVLPEIERYRKEKHMAMIEPPELEFNGQQQKAFDEYEFNETGTIKVKKNTTSSENTEQKYIGMQSEDSSNLE